MLAFSLLEARADGQQIFFRAIRQPASRPRRVRAASRPPCTSYEFSFLLNASLRASASAGRTLRDHAQPVQPMLRVIAASRFSGRRHPCLPLLRTEQTRFQARRLQGRD
eukprot:359622-Chlamydomonas_euryale.AAC.16